jgi:hypothetical protein
MRKVTIIIFFIISGLVVKGISPQESSTHQSLSLSVMPVDTLKSIFIKNNPPYLFQANLNHRERSLGNKLVRGNFYAMGYDAIAFTGLFFAPSYISKWENRKEKFKLSSIVEQYKIAYTKPPIIDNDLFFINFLGHPYQGGFYYNCMRSQGATMLQSSLFCLGQALLWEYVYEASAERPSVQDLITTPLVGILWGELSHIATIAMSKNGFKWYEITAVCIINPAYPVNNGLRFNKTKPVKKY